MVQVVARLTKSKGPESKPNWANYFFILFQLTCSLNGFSSPSIIVFIIILMIKQKKLVAEHNWLKKVQYFTRSDGNQDKRIEILGQMFRLLGYNWIWLKCLATN